MKVNNKLFFVFAIVFSLTLAAGSLCAANTSTESANKASQTSAVVTGNIKAGAGLTAHVQQPHKYVSPAMRWYDPDNSSP